MSSQSGVAALILAAGESSRMGKDKALLAYHGHSFLETIIGNLRQAGIDRILVVLGHHAAQIRQSFASEHAQVVVNEDYRLGQTSSLQVGLKALDLPPSDGILLCLVDHPAVSPGIMKRILLAHSESGAPVVVPVHQGRRGHPVFIGRALFQEILALGPGEGANSVIRKYCDSTYWLEVDEGGVVLDVDDSEQYQQLLREAVR
jgi:molybdenum cofactor cytidylyltransferase